MRRLALSLLAATLTLALAGAGADLHAQGAGADATGGDAASPPSGAAADAARRKADRIAELEEVSNKIALSQQRLAELRKEVASIEADRARLSQELIAVAARVQEAEEAVSENERRLATLEESEQRIRSSLAARHDVMAEVLAALQRIGRQPPPALAVTPGDALKAVRSAILLGAVLPDLRTEAQALIADLNNLVEVKETIERERANMIRKATGLAEDRARIRMLLAERKSHEAKSNEALAAERARAKELAAQADTLRSLIDDLDAELARARKLAAQPPEARPPEEMPRMAPSIPFAEAKGRLVIPAKGVRIRGFGERDGTGAVSQGESIATRAAARVVAPSDGWVAYAGPFRSYGQILILNAGGGYHVVLAGMDRIDVELGQFVLAGEPVAVMGSRVLASAAATDVATSQPVLYVEFRKDGVPIDPEPWWAGSTDGKVRG